ncbi:LANO_0F12728g1_1 [Lachancea nothofagi CBS 11611]|uniref:Altered inheritance of mitochondria protein 24, mitochondrial n=1 Tax=Lachancea nothofagi CBS 11611 TaxID=1266666 RepID=A0A1G4KBJ2_9SACH|nr:LANO_0F12728g1_1 [Lachancea nothofagi CBS 11611]
MNFCLKRITTIRRLSLIKPNSSSSIVPSQLAQRLDVEPLFGSENQTLESKFRTLGTPATLCSASLPASVPLYVRRGCLVSLHNVQDLHIEHSWLGLTWSLIKHGSWRPALYHKLVSPRPFNALVAPNVNHSRWSSWFGFSSQPFRTLCLLELNGSQDWYVFGKNSLIAYEGNTSLEIKQSGIWPDRSSALPSTYKLLQGRGNALLSGAGSVYTIELQDESDELVLKSEHLLAIGSKTARDAKECVSEYRLTSPVQMVSPETTKVEPSPSNVKEFDFKMFREMTTTAVVAAWNWTKRTYTTYVNGSTKFLRIRGPRLLLVQSSHNVFMPATPSSQSAFRNSPAQMPKQSQGRVKDYLSYVSVQPNGEVRFESTPNFDARVAEIEALKLR